MRHLAVFLLCLAPALAQDRMYQFAVDQDRLAGAPDFSFLNHPLTPADRVFVKNGHFYTVGPDLKPNTADDRRIRFFGVNTAFGGNFPEEKDARRVAKRLRRLGVNLVRLHHMDSSPDRDPANAGSLLTTDPYPTLNPVAVSRLRAFLDALAAEGIYANLNLHVGYEFRPAVDHVPAVTGSDRLPTQSKPLHIFYPRMVELQLEYTKKAISALKLKSDPVLAMVEIDNETSLIDAWQKNQIDRFVTGEYRAELDRQKKEFLKERPDSTDETIRFMVARDRAYLNRMLGAIRESTDALLPVAGTQVGFGGLLNYDSHQDLDFQDNHFYIDHYNFPNRPWDGRDWRQRNSTSTSTDFATYLNMAFTRQAGRPYTVSEFNQPYPNTYAAEIDPTLAAFAAFQDWDAIDHFAWEHGRQWDRGGPSGFNLNGDWTKWPGIGQSAWIFRTGAVATAKEAVNIPLPEESRMESARRKMNGNAVRFLQASGLDPHLGLVHRVAMATAGTGPMPEFPKPAAPAVFQADTRELTFSQIRRTFHIEAPQVNGIFGFVGKQQDSAGMIALELGPNSRDFIAFLLTALDQRPIEASGHMLLTVPGYTTRPDQKLINYPGTADWWTLSPDPSVPDKPSGAYSAPGPMMMERVEATVTLRTGKNSVTVYPLDGAGGRMAPLDAKDVVKGEHRFRIHLAAETPWYEIVAR
jgi:hypothetical protein